MRKYNKDELDYYGLVEQKLYSQDDYEQKLDEQDFGTKFNKDKPIHNRGKNKLQKQENNKFIEEEKFDKSVENNQSITEISANIDQKYEDIKPGDILQTTVDQWSNGNLISIDTIFTAVSSPKKVKKIAKDDIDNIKTKHEYFVHGKTLLKTGQVVEVRINMHNCKKLDNITLKDLDEDLKW